MNTSSNTNRIPLENHPLERAVLGALIADTQLFWQMKNRVRESLFTVVTHGRIAKVLHSLVEDGRDINLPGIISRLPVEENSNFNVGGYLATLVADEADPDNIGQFMDDLEQMEARRQMAKLGAELIRQSTEDNGLDAMGRLEKAKDEIESLSDPMGSSMRHVGDIAQDVINRVDKASDSEKTVGLDIGLKAMQDLTGPFMPGRLYVVAGPPGSGKTGLAYQAAAFVAKREPVAVISIEMGSEELVERDLAGRTGIQADKIERAALNVDEIDTLFNAALELAEIKLYIDAASNVTAAQIRAKAMRMKRIKGLSMLVIDHLLYIRKPNEKMSEFDGIRFNMQAMKKLAKDLGIPVVLLTQLKKEFGDGTWNMMRRPNVGDLYGGSSIEQEADVLLFVHREEYLLGRKEPAQDAKDRAEWEIKLDKVQGKAELLLGKRRGGAGFGIRTLYFEGAKVRFSDQAPRNPIDFTQLSVPRGQGDLLDADDREAAKSM